MLFENMTTNQMWSIPQNKINATINKNVQRTKSVFNSTAKRTYMDVIQSTDQSAETHTAWQRYMSTHEGSDYQEYAKARNQARNGLQTTQPNGLQTTQPTSGGAVTVVSSCCANCVEPPRPQQWGPDLPYFGHAGHADPLDGWRCCSQNRVMSRPIQVRQL